MLWKLVERFVGSEWRAFCGLSSERFLSLATDVLDELGYEYAVEEVTTTHGEQTMLGSDETGTRIDVTAPADFEVEVVRATNDPITRIGLSLVLTSDQREELTGDLCVVSLRRITDTNREAIAGFVNRVIAESERPPWNVSHHVRFRLAVLLRYKIKVLWGYWRRI